jgi:predicted nucleic acid-binding protein
MLPLSNSATAAMRKLFTTAWIVQELADGLARAALRAAFLRLLSAIRADDRTEIVLPNAELWVAGLSLYAERPDKDWSLTDCI